MDARIAGLLRRLPSLAPSTSIIADHAHLSARVTALASRHDPIIGSMLAFGRLSDMSLGRPLAVAAFPAATAPNLLTLATVHPQKQGWHPNKGLWINTSRISGEFTTWDALHPIRQLCFCAAPSEDPHAASPYLSVRTSSAVHVLRVSLRKVSDDTALTRFRITPVTTLNMDLLDNVPPADVAFNPFYNKQLATIDQNGTWRVWELSRHPAGPPGYPVRVASGAVADESLASTEGRVLDDGWGRVAWVSDACTIVTASRRAIAVYDVTSKPLRLSCPELGIAGTSHWILDICSQTQPSHVCFVLTSVHLICLRIQSLAGFGLADPASAGAHVVFRIPHFRDPEDISLRLSPFTDDSDVVIMITSSLSPTATVYRCSTVETSSLPFLTVSDPTLLPLPEYPSDSDASHSTLGLHVQPTRYGEGKGGRAGPGKSYKDNSIRFYAVTSIFSDMSVAEKLYYARPEVGSMDRDPILVSPPDWQGRLTYGTSRLRQHRFVVDDDDIMEDLEVHMPPSTPHPQARGSGKTSSRKTQSTWTVIHERAYDEVNKRNQGEEQDFIAALDATRMVYETIREKFTGIPTL